MFINILLIIASVLFLLYLWIKRVYSYWERKNVPFIPPTFPKGNLKDGRKLKKSLPIMIRDLYDELKNAGHKYAGVYTFTSAQFLPIDPEIIKSVMARDFANFVDRGVFHNKKRNDLSAQLFSIEGEEWKSLRAKLTPTFTTGKIKTMMQTLIDCGNDLQEEIERVCSISEPFDIKETMACYTSDIIGSVAFGIECNSFKDKDSPFRKNCDKALRPSQLYKFLLMFCMIFQDLARALNISPIPADVVECFTNLVRDAVEYRTENNVTRNDFMQLLMDLKKDGVNLTIAEMAAQAFVFFVGGFETSSTTMSFALYELSRNQEMQDRLREEVREMLDANDGKITYDAVMGLKYMDQVISETLRKYPPVPLLNRICTKDYRIPDTDIIIEKKTRTLIPVYGLHHDPEYFPEPENFDPERFSPENKSKIVPFTYLPFGEGPRACIGIRFGQVQTKVGLATVLKDHRYTLNDKTGELVWNEVSFLLATEGPIYLNAEKI